MNAYLAIVPMTLLAGCSVRIDASNTTLERASTSQIRGDPEASGMRPDGGGSWALLTTSVSRETVERVARWQVYPHVYIVECSTGRETNVGTEPRIESVDFANEIAVHALLDEAESRKFYQVRSLVFVRKDDLVGPQCLQFRGGSYLGQKIVEERAHIRLIGSLP